MNISKLKVFNRALILLVMSVNIYWTDADAAPVVYFKTKMLLNAAVEDSQPNGNSKISISTATQGTLVNLVLGTSTKSRPANNAHIMALRVDCSGAYNAQWVVYDLNTRTEVKPISQSVDLFEEERSVFKKINGGTRVEARAYEEVEFVDSDPADSFNYALKSGHLALVGKAKPLDAQGCPVTISGTLSGYINFKFLDDVSGPVPVVGKGVIGAGSTFTARRLP